MSHLNKLGELPHKLDLLINFFVNLVRWFNSKPLPGIMILPSSQGEGQ